MKKILIFALCLSFAATMAFAQMGQGMGQGQGMGKNKNVSRSAFATSIVDREPADDITSFSVSAGGNVCFFAELMNMEGTTASYVWSKNGEEIFKFPVNVNGPRWRASSTMKAGHFKAGDLVKVQVVGDDGTVYAEKELTIE